MLRIMENTRRELLDSFYHLCQETPAEQRTSATHFKSARARLLFWLAQYDESVSQVLLEPQNEAVRRKLQTQWHDIRKARTPYTQDVAKTMVAPMSDEQVAELLDVYETLANEK